MIVRTAAVGDAQRLSELLAQLGYDADSRLVIEKLGLARDSEGDAVFVAEIDKSVIGCISVHTYELFHRRGRSGRITALIVDMAHRNNGVGRALVKTAERYFASRKCVRAEVTSGESRLDAHRFYAANGYAQGRKYFVKPL
jgi:GNAT superfamily N-acetyltransferase